MIKWWIVPLAAAGVLFAYEDVSFSARTLGLGGVQAVLSGDVMASPANPALSARLTRSQVTLSGAPYQSRFYWTAGFSQPVKSLGNIGGTLLYYPDADVSRNETDLRLFWAIPLGQYFNFGAAIGNHSSYYYGAYLLSRPGNQAYLDRTEVGSFFSLGLLCSTPKGFNFGVALRDAGVNFSFTAPSTVNAGFGWGSEFKSTPLLSSALLAVEGRFITDGNIQFSLGAEGFLFDEILGLRAGMNYDQEGISPALGASLRTHRIEKTDFELHYGLSLISNQDSALTLHQISLNVLFGDARKAVKDSILAAQAERARRLREQALARERDRLREELDQIKKERAALERERSDIERLRREALEEVGRIPGLGIVDTDSLINITLTDQALRFDEGSAQIPFPEGYRVLARIGEFLANYPGKVLRIEVHTDNVPLAEEFGETYKDNQALSEARAEVVRSYFINVEGIRASLITAKGLGSKEPVADNETEEGRAQNRRIVILIRK